MADTAHLIRILQDEKRGSTWAVTAKVTDSTIRCFEAVVEGDTVRCVAIRPQLPFPHHAPFVEQCMHRSRFQRETVHSK